MDRPWSEYHLVGDTNVWIVVIPPGPDNETSIEEYLRAYEAAWIYHQIMCGARTLQPAKIPYYRWES